MKNYLLSYYIFDYSILNNNKEIGNIGSYLKILNSDDRQEKN